MCFAPNIDIPAACGCGLERIHPHFLWLLEDFISQEAFFSPSYGCFFSMTTHSNRKKEKWVNETDFLLMCLTVMG